MLPERSSERFLSKLVNCAECITFSLILFGDYPHPEVTGKVGIPIPACVMRVLSQKTQK
jgi:hypothetical protein